MEFLPNDIVTCAFLDGEHEVKESAFGKIKICNKTMQHIFYKDGKIYQDHDKPLLILIRRPKKLVKKEVDVCFSENALMYSIFSVTQARANAEGWIDAKLVYEVESDE